MLRKLVILSLTVVGSTVVWMASDFTALLSSAGQHQTETQQVSDYVENPSSQYENERGLIGKRLIALAIFVLLAPVVTAPLANKILDRQSNTGNLLLLFGYMGLDVLAAYMVGAVYIGGILSAIVCFVSLLIIFSYNLWICAFLARLRK